MQYRKIWLCSTVLLGSMAIAACNNSSEPNTTPSETSGTTIPLPRMLANSRAIDNALLTVEVRVANELVTLTPNADRTQWTGNIDVPPNQQVQLFIQWRHDGLLVAGMDRTIGPYSSNNSTLTLTDNDYDSTGLAYDKDGDGISNLAELEQDTDPNNNNDPGMGGVAFDLDVEIPAISPAEAPTIDGLYDDVWNDATFTDREGDQLFIDNLMIDLGATFPDQNTGFRWGAMHDGSYLYVLVVAEFVDGETLQADSTKPWRDDSLNIYIDGDNSKGTDYDGVDDYHFFIPFLKLLEPIDVGDLDDLAGISVVTDPNNGDLISEAPGTILVQTNTGILLNAPTKPLEANNSRDSNGRVEPGANSANVSADSIEFANCKCTSEQHTYEVKINIADFGITLDQPFGFELHLDDDIDGGGRDARYGWIHPSRTTTNIDETWKNPSFMGTAILRP